MIKIITILAQLKRSYVGITIQSVGYRPHEPPQSQVKGQVPVAVGSRQGGHLGGATDKIGELQSAT